MQWPCQLIRSSNTITPSKAYILPCAATVQSHGHAADFSSFEYGQNRVDHFGFRFEEYRHNARENYIPISLALCA
jgi:hypothetical protein